MSIARKISNAGKVLCDRKIAGEFQECSFQRADLQRTDLSNSTFLGCSFELARLIGATFKLSCRQGNNNQLDDLNTMLFLYWLQHVFNLSEKMQAGIDAILGNNKARLKEMFDRQLAL